MEKEKNILMFSGQGWYPDGGMDDYKGAVETVDTAKSILKSYTSDDWFQIVDKKEMKVLHRGTRKSTIYDDITWY